MSDDQWIENKQMIEDLKAKKPAGKKEEAPAEEASTETPEASAESPTPEAGSAEEAQASEAEIASAVASTPLESKNLTGVVLSEWFKDISQPISKIINTNKTIN